MTLRANAAGLARFLTNQPVSPGIPSPVWNGLELSASFDTGKGTTKEIRGIPENASQEVIRRLWAPAPCSNCGIGAFTLNAAWTGYAEAQPNGERDETATLRDATTAFQFDRDVGPDDTPIALFVSGYFQWQANKGVLQIAPDTTTLPGTTIPIPADGLKILTQKGWLRVFQAGIVFTLPGGVKAPLSFAYANRTEFRKKPDARGFIGLLLNTAALR